MDMEHIGLRDTNVNFQAWLDQADAYCIARSGVSLSDLPDGNSWDTWNDGGSPEEYVDELLAEEGFPEE